MQAVETSGSFYDRIIVGSGLLGGALIVLNVVPLEDYLLGVVPSEMPS